MKTTVIENQSAKNNKSVQNNNRPNITGKEAKNDRLKGTIDNLDTFTIQANEDGDVTGNNKFYRCELMIRDDNGNEFVTKNAYIIDHVSQYVNSLCVEKLAEIEAEIIILA